MSSSGNERSRGQRRGFAENPDGSYVTPAGGLEVLENPLLNKGTAFTPQERADLDLDGLLPPVVETLEEQAPRALRAVSGAADRPAQERLPDRRCTTATRCCSTGCWPITCARCCRSSTPRRSARRSSATATSTAARAASTCRSTTPDGIEQALPRTGPRSRRRRPDRRLRRRGDPGHRRLGCAAASTSPSASSPSTPPPPGSTPRRVIPVVAGRRHRHEQLLNDPLYLGNRHSRVARDGATTPSSTPTSRRPPALFPNAMLHWEDFGPCNARRILERYRDRISPSTTTCRAPARSCSRAVLAARTRLRHADARPADRRLRRRHRGHRDRRPDARRDGPRRPDREDGRPPDLVRSTGRACSPTTWPTCATSRSPTPGPAAEVAGWARATGTASASAEVVERVQPTMLLGTSTVARRLHREDRARHGRRTSTGRSSCRCPTRPSAIEAMPADLIALDRRPGADRHRQPVRPGHLQRRHLRHRPGQQRPDVPGAGAGRDRRAGRAGSATACSRPPPRRSAGWSTSPRRARRCCPRWTTSGRSRPRVAVAVAKQAAEEHLARVDLHDPVQQVQDAMWQPEYRPVRAA